jgi:hypothetical protein
MQMVDGFHIAALSWLSLSYSRGEPVYTAVPRS